MPYTKSKIHANEKVANFISVVANPFAVAILSFALMNFFVGDGSSFWLIAIVSISFGGIIPIIINLVWIKKRRIEPDIPQKEDRIYPLSMIILVNLLGVIILYFLGAPPLITALMFFYFSNTLIVLFISFYWKISIHCMGISGPATALTYAFGLPGVVFSLILIPVMWSRVHLKRHTPSQVLVGALLGFILTAIQFKIIFG